MYITIWPFLHSYIYALVVDNSLYMSPYERSIGKIRTTTMSSPHLYRYIEELRSTVDRIEFITAYSLNVRCGRLP